MSHSYLYKNVIHTCVYFVEHVAFMIFQNNSFTLWKICHLIYEKCVNDLKPFYMHRDLWTMHNFHEISEISRPPRVYSRKTLPKRTTANFHKKHARHSKVKTNLGHKRYSRPVVFLKCCTRKLTADISQSCLQTIATPVGMTIWQVWHIPDDTSWQCLPVQRPGLPVTLGLSTGVTLSCRLDIPLL